MLDIIWILLLLIAIFLMLIIAEFDYHDYPYHWVIILTLMDVILWAVLSADVWALEIPYEVYNVSSEAIETGTHIFTSQVSAGLSYFCMMMAIVMFVYLSYTSLMAFRVLFDQRGRMK